jgi:RNA polymerase sigma-70 factor (ECF subfamily)
LARIRPRGRREIPTDAELIEASWTEPSHFGELFERHFDAIFGYLARRAPREEAADLAAETFRLAFTARHRYDTTRESARPWLYGFATNVHRHHLRSVGRRDRAFERAVRFEGSAAAPPCGDFDLALDRLDDQRSWPRVAAALDALPSDEADALILLAWEGLTYQAIATATGVPVGTVRSRINRARRRLRELLEVDGQPPVDRPPHVQEVPDHG